VSLDLTGALLLEVRGSLHLFGGLGAMRARLADELQSWGHCAVMASAPTAKAASWLARADMEIDCTAIHALPGVLRTLPLACLDWPINVQHQLLQMGVSLLADCVRLPRDGFARRIGPAYLQDLDQGFGRYPELLHYYQPAAVFDARLDLGADIQSVDDIATGLEELFDRLAAFLRQRQAGVRQLQVKLFHHRRSPTVLVIKVHEVCASATHCMELCRLQLDRLTIPAPVTGLSLRTEAAVTHDFSDDDLLRRIPLAKVVAGHGEVSSGRINRFIEQLRARLGSGRVYVPHVVAEHRPEYAWHAAEPCSSRFSPVPGELVNRLRPLWLLQQPLPLESRCNRPVQHGAIIPLGDAERIESGWWDGLDIRRDYYRTANRLGVRLWIYRDCRNSAWYLHGLFA
jgi:protein ImuB